MKFDNWFNIESKNPPPGFEKVIVSSSHYLSIYVIFCILLEIKNQIGLEAMLEYIHKYMQRFKESYPRKGEVVKKEIMKVDVLKMYKNARG